MNKNVKIAKELIMLAKILVSKNKTENDDNPFTELKKKSVNFCDK